MIFLYYMPLITAINLQAAGLPGKGRDGEGKGAIRGRGRVLNAVSEAGGMSCGTMAWGGCLSFIYSHSVLSYSLIPSPVVSNSSNNAERFRQSWQ